MSSDISISSITGSGSVGDNPAKLVKRERER
jgi:hypothetical protein